MKEVNVNNNGQSKVKESKVKESKLNESKEKQSIVEDSKLNESIAKQSIVKESEPIRNKLSPIMLTSEFDNKFQGFY